ncbi:MAG TPA: NAD-dependent epimerase/dehydratase family protein [Planctomycetes bacterium]|nr:NAD-dependent epimerase/dehydratase family protein [Planctomycetota bacterium]
MSRVESLFLTGATGFVGSALVREARSRGHEVHALVRSSSPREHLEGLGVHWHEGDLLDRSSLERGIRSAGGCECCVVHAAARISYRKKEHELSGRVNVHGTEQVLAACDEVRPRRLVHVSSVVAVGVASGPTDALTEDAPFNGGRLDAAYVETKRAAEELVLAAGGELDVVVVNPGAIFGPSPRTTNTMRLLSRIAASRMRIPAAPGSLAVVGVEDVADGILAAIERGAPGRRYLLTESNWTMSELLREIYSALGMDRRPLAVRPFLWKGITVGAGWLDRIHPLEVTTPTALRLLGEHFRFDSSRAQRELAWKPRPFREVLHSTLAWMRSHGMLPLR